MDFHYPEIPKKESMRTNVVLPVWVPPPEVRPAAGLFEERSAQVVMYCTVDNNGDCTNDVFC